MQGRRFVLTALGQGMVESRMYEQALPYLDSALKIANATPDAGYQFLAQEVRLGALTGLKQFDAAQKLAEEILFRARQARRNAHEADVLGRIVALHRTRGDNSRALSTLHRELR
jgi:hypothetical protein